MRFLLSGASGFLGAALRTRLATEGHEVVRLVRREPATATEFTWDPTAGEIDSRAFDGVDVVVNLSGAAIFGKPWTEARREVLLSSRTQTTGTLAAALADVAEGGSAPALIQAGGVAIYGTAPTATPHTEDSPVADDWLAQLSVAWQQAADPAREAGVRVVDMRTSPVLDASGGVLKIMKLAWSLGGGAVLGNGRQRMAMISLHDYLRFVLWAASNPDASGPYNLTIPVPTTNAEFTDALAQALHRPRLLKAPAALVRLPLGEQADQLLGDLYIVPERLTAAGFTFDAPDVRSTIDLALRSV